MSRALFLSGGAYRGMVQVPVINYLCSKYVYDAIYGVSVGALNGVMAAANKIDELNALWNSIQDRSAFLSLNWYWPFKSLFSLKPLERQLKTNIFLDEINTVFKAGVVNLHDGEYYNLSTVGMKSTTELHGALLSSCSIVGIMDVQQFWMNNQWNDGADGGWRNIIPVADCFYDHIDIVTCTPLKRIEYLESPKWNAISLLSRGFDIMQDEIFDFDQSELLKWCNTAHVYSPREPVGSQLEATPDILQNRRRIGVEMISNPLKITRE